MRRVVSSRLGQCRITTGRYASSAQDGHNGAFSIHGPCGAVLKVIASDGTPEYPWEHVSVSVAHRTPNWMEMEFICRLFWDEEECVMQLHPPRSDWVNVHPHCLHLWRPLTAEIPRPPSILVGPKDHHHG